MKVENGISINALNKAAIALYCFQVLESQRPIPVIGKNNISETNAKNPSDSSSMVSSCDLFWIAVPANNINAINMIFIIIELRGNPK